MNTYEAAPPVVQMMMVAGAALVSLLVVTSILFGLRAMRTPEDEAWFLGSLLVSLCLSLLAPAGYLLATERWEPELGYFMLAGIPLGLLFLGGSVGSWVEGSYLRNLPLSPCDYAAQGFAKLFGIARATYGLVESKTGGIASIYYSETTERRRRTETREYDSQSKTHRVRTTEDWALIDQSSEAVRFELEDETGRRDVDPVRAEWSAPRKAYFRNGQPVDGPVHTASVGETRTTVAYVPPDVPLWVMGQLVGRTVRYDGFRKCFVIVDGKDSGVYTSRTVAAVILLLIGMALTGGLIYFWINGPVVERSEATLATDLSLGLAGAGLLGVLWFVGGWNGLVRWRRLALKAWSDIEVHLQARADLIPNLVESARAAATHEGDLLERVAAARTQTLKADGLEERVEAEDAIERMMPRLLILQESVPQLGSIAAFLELQRALVDVEEEIAQARQRYNQAVSNYNEAQQAFPLSIVSSIAGRSPMPLFEVEATQRHAQPVSLA
jgi:LemA protein